MTDGKEGHRLIFLSLARRRIHAELRANPRLDSQELSHRLRLPPAKVRAHLELMREAHAVEVHPGTPRTFSALPAAPSLELAHLLLTSLPARELVQYLVDHPGQHLGQAAKALDAPRSRYWRVVEVLVENGLLRRQRNVRQRLLFPTPLSRKAVESLRRDDLDRMILRKGRRRAKADPEAHAPGPQREFPHPT